MKKKRRQIYVVEVEGHSADFEELLSNLGKDVKLWVKFRLG